MQLGSFLLRYFGYPNYIDMVNFVCWGNESLFQMEEYKLTIVEIAPKLISPAISCWVPHILGEIEQCCAEVFGLNIFYCFICRSCSSM